MKLKLAKMPMPKAPGTDISNPAKVGSTAVKTPKSKMLPQPGDKPSVFFKTEQNTPLKRPSIQKLRDFLDKKHKAK